MVIGIGFRFSNSLRSFQFVNGGSDGGVESVDGKYNDCGISCD